MKILTHPLHLNPQNKVVAIMGHRGRNFADSVYEVLPNTAVVTELPIARLQFQDGPIGKDDTIIGIHNEDLILILMNRIQMMNSVEQGYHDECNTNAYNHLEYALMHLCKRTQERRKNTPLDPANQI